MIRSANTSFTAISYKHFHYNFCSSLALCACNERQFYNLMHLKCRLVKSFKVFSELFIRKMFFLLSCAVVAVVAAAAVLDGKWD